MSIRFPTARMATVIGLAAALAALAGTAVRAATAVMIWPIDPVIESDQRATALWLENRGARPVTLQTRVVGWRQQGRTDVHDQDQSAIAISPPLTTVQPGARQLIRLIRLADAAPHGETAYRILIDEITRPDDDASGTSSQVSMGVRFQMHYSLPLFVYGRGLRGRPMPDARDKAAEVAVPALSWSIRAEPGRRWLVLTNRGAIHARVTHLTYLDAGRRVEQDLLGYVLSGASMEWAMPDTVAEPSGLRLLATVDGKAEVAIPSGPRP